MATESSWKMSDAIAREKLPHHHGGVLALSVLVPWALDVRWIWLNKLPPANDVAGYFANATAIGRVIDAGNLREFVALFLFPVFSPERPPFLSLLAGGVYALHPYVPWVSTFRALTTVLNTVVLTLAAVYLYRFCTALGISRWVRPFAVFVFLSLPGVFGPARLFGLDLPLAVCVLASAYYLYRLYQGESSPGIWILLGLWGAAGLLIKETYPLYVAGPLVLMVLSRLRARLPVWPSILAAAVPTLVLALPWYGVHLSTTLHNAVVNSFGTTGRLFARPGRPWSLAWLLWYPVNSVSYGFSVLYTAVGLALMTGGFLVRRQQEPKGRALWPFLVVWFGIPFVFLALLVEDVGIRFLLPSFGACVLAGAVGANVLEARFPKAVPGILAGLAVIGCAQLVAYTYGVNGHDTYVALRTQPPLVLFQDEAASAYNGTRLTLNLEPYRSVAWPDQAILRRAMQTSPDTVPVLGVATSYPLLNSINLTAIAIEQSIPVQVVSLEQTSYPQLLQTVSLVLTKTKGQGPSFTVRYRTAIWNLLRNGHAFHRVAAWRLPDGSVATLWQRVQGTGAIVRQGDSVYLLGTGDVAWRLTGVRRGIGPWPRVSSVGARRLGRMGGVSDALRLIQFPGSPTAFVRRGSLWVPEVGSPAGQRPVVVRLARNQWGDILALP